MFYYYCLRCGGKIIKDGIRHNKSGDRQTYRCKECHHKFIILPDKRIKSHKINKEEIMKLYYQLPLRTICSLINNEFGVNLTHGAIIKWRKKYGLPNMSRYERVLLKRDRYKNADRNIFSA